MCLKLHTPKSGLLLVTPILTLLLTMSSCGERFSTNTTTIHVSTENKQWLLDLNNYESFTMLDELFNPEVFTLNYERYYYNGASHSSGPFGLESEKLEFEGIEQEFLSDKASDFSIDVLAHEFPQGTWLIVEVNNVRYKYDLKIEELTAIETTIGSKHHIYFEGTYMKTDTIFSTAVYHDTLAIDLREYYGVMEFTLLDFHDQMEGSIVVDIAVAKELGLIRYSLADGTVISRK